MHSPAFIFFIMSRALRCSIYEMEYSYISCAVEIPAAVYRRIQRVIITCTHPHPGGAPPTQSSDFYKLKILIFALY